MESTKRSLIKALSYRITQFFFSFIVFYFLTNDVFRSLEISLFVDLCKVLFYYLHERVWSRIRYGRVYQPGKTIWFTGLSGSGKSTIADALVVRLKEKGYAVQILDGDKIRHTINKDLGFSPEDRNKNIERIAHIAQLHNEAGVVCIVPVISPYNELRDLARGIIKDFTGVYIKCPLEVCESRDPKGLYKKVRAGEIKKFTGISDPFEEPTNFELTIHTDQSNLEQCVNQILSATNL